MPLSVITHAWILTGSMTTTRAGQTATLLPNGTVLAAGGQGPNDDANGTTTYLASAEIYDPSTGIWALTGSMSTARMGQAATLLPIGTVLVAGGMIYLPSSGEIYSSAEMYDPSTGTWTLTGSMSTERTNQTATLLPNGTVLAAGGISPTGSLSAFSVLSVASAEIYDPSTGIWTPTGSMSTARAGQTASLLPNGPSW